MLASPSVTTTLRSYFGARFARSFAAVFLVLGLVLVTIDLLLHAEEAMSGPRGASGAVGFLALRSAALYLPVLVPVSTFLAAFLTAGVAAHNREVVAVKASGVSPLRALLPVVLAAALASAATLVLTETVSVPAAAALEGRPGDDRADRYRSPDGLWYHTGRFVYNVRPGASEGDVFRDVRIFERDQRGRLLRTIEAARGTRLAESRWRFEGARIRSFDPERAGRAPGFLETPEIELDLAEGEDRRLERGSLAAVSLERLVDASRGADAGRTNAVLHDRLSHALLALALALVAIPLGLGVERSRSVARQAGLCALVLLAVLAAREVTGSMLGAGGAAVAGSWISLALLAGCGVVGMARAPL